MGSRQGRGFPIRMPLRRFSQIRRIQLISTISDSAGRMLMNRLQRAALILMLAIDGLLCLFPPFANYRAQNASGYFPLGHHWHFSSVSDFNSRSYIEYYSIDFGRLALEIAVVTLIGGTAVVLFRSFPDERVGAGLRRFVEWSSGHAGLVSTSLAVAAVAAIFATALALHSPPVNPHDALSGGNRSEFSPAKATTSAPSTAAASSGQSGVVMYRAYLSGPNEVPPVQSQAKGVAAINVDTATKQASWRVDYTGLSGPAAEAYIYCGAYPGPKINAAFSLGYGPKAASPITGSGDMTDAQFAALLAGKCYVNIHTEANKGGEIRGQLAR